MAGSQAWHGSACQYDCLGFIVYIALSCHCCCQFLTRWWRTSSGSNHKFGWCSIGNKICNAERFRTGFAWSAWWWQNENRSGG